MAYQSSRIIEGKNHPFRWTAEIQFNICQDLVFFALIPWLKWPFAPRAILYKIAANVTLPIFLLSKNLSLPFVLLFKTSKSDLINLLVSVEKRFWRSIFNLELKKRENNVYQQSRPLSSTHESIYPSILVYSINFSLCFVTIEQFTCINIINS